MEQIVKEPRPKRCTICRRKTTKEINGHPVCNPCFVAGWGRLPEMPLVAKGVETKVTFIIPEWLAHLDVTIREFIKKLFRDIKRLRVTIRIYLKEE